LRKFAPKFGYVPLSLVWVMASGVSVMAQTQSAPAVAEAAPLGAVDAPAADAPAGEGAADDAAPTVTAPTVTRGREIVVIADKVKGQVEAPQPPIAVFDEDDIAAYGAT